MGARVPEGEAPVQVPLDVEQEVEHPIGGVYVVKDKKQEVYQVRGKKLMMYVLYKTKKELKESIGKKLKYQETSLFSPEYQSNGMITATNPKRSFYTQVFMKNGLIEKVL